MIAMQYSFTLPADYDMSIIRHRIDSKGSLMDSFPGLAFKAFQYARLGGDEYETQENLYAPFYLWNDAEGMNRFIEGEGFAALTESFGWPSIKTWSVWQATRHESMNKACFATRETCRISPHASIQSVKATAVARATALSSQQGCLGVLVAFEPTGWTQVQYALWETKPPRETEAPLQDKAGIVMTHTERQTYEVGYIALGAVR